MCAQEHMFFIVFLSHSYPLWLATYLVPTKCIHYLPTYLDSNHFHFLSSYLWYFTTYLGKLPSECEVKVGGITGYFT
jgi:hypothetical protein